MAENLRGDVRPGTGCAPVCSAMPAAADGDADPSGPVALQDTAHDPAHDSAGEGADTGASESADVSGDGFCFWQRSALAMPECADSSVALTVTSPPYWNAIDYDIHAGAGKGAWYRARDYAALGDDFPHYLDRLQNIFAEVMRATVPGGFCAIVIGTILYKRKHYPLPMLLTQRMWDIGWEFHQDIIWNKVTGGVKRAGCFIQNPRAGYYYPNIMTEYILIFRKPGPIRRGGSPALPVDALFTRDIANNVWHIAPVPPGQIDHPCPFPEELVRRLVALYSDPGDTVLDPFLGSGQTALAARKAGRYCIGYDIEGGYLSLAARRLANPPASRPFNLIPAFEKLAATPSSSPVAAPPCPRQPGT